MKKEKKFKLLVIFGEDASKNAGWEGFEKTAKKIGDCKIDGSVGEYAFSTQEDLDTAASMLDDSDGWLGVFWKKKVLKDTPGNRTHEIRRATIDAIKKILEKHNLTDVDASELSDTQLVIEENPYDANCDMTLDCIRVKNDELLFSASSCTNETTIAADETNLETLLSVLDLLEQNEDKLDNPVSDEKPSNEEGKNEEQVNLTILCDKGFVADSLRQLANAIEESEEKVEHFETARCDAEIDYDYAN